MQSNDEIKEIFKKTVQQFVKPINQDDLEFELIENGLETVLKPIEITRFMAEINYKKKQIMVNGERERLWVNTNIHEPFLSKKIRLSKWLKEFLIGKNEVAISEIRDLCRKQGIEWDVLSKHFYYTDESRAGMARKWQGWIITGKEKEKFYKKVDVEQPENDF